MAVTYDNESPWVAALARVAHTVYAWDAKFGVPISTPSPMLKCGNDADTWYPTVRPGTAYVVYLRGDVPSPDLEGIAEALRPLAEAEAPEGARARSPPICLVYESEARPADELLLATVLPSLGLALRELARLTLGQDPDADEADPVQRRTLVLEATLQRNAEETVLAIYLRLHLARRNATKGKSPVSAHLMPNMTLVQLPGFVAAGTLPDPEPDDVNT